MPHQLALTIRAPIRPGQADALQRLLAALADPGSGRRVPFERLAGTHFARLFVLEEMPGIPASLVYMSDIDAPAWRHLTELVEAGGSDLDAVFAHCQGWPAEGAAGWPRGPWRRAAWLRAHSVRANTVYVNTVGRGAAQVRDERRLHDAIEEFLDAGQADWGEADPVQLHAAVRRFVAGRKDLRWALRPARPPGLWFRLGAAVQKVGWPLLALCAAPLLLVVLPVWALALRRQERREPPGDDRPDPARLRELAALEDHVVQNPFTAVGWVKPGRLRLWTMLAVLKVVDYGTRHIFNRGVLTGVRSIHFARWVALDGDRRLIFASSYDGSLESYMDEFIDKVAWGLNAVFSNGQGYPATRWLLFGGAHDEQAFKRFLRTRQVPTQLWYSAYDDLSTANIANNAAIRAGLARAEAPSTVEAEAWLARL